jgi:hypothetical protein
MYENHMFASYVYGAISPKENIREKKIEYTYVQYEKERES